MEYKTLTCEVCGEEFRPHRDKRYTAVEVTGILVPNLYHDAIDCPHCGCQILLGDRFRSFKEDDDESQTD